MFDKAELLEEFRLYAERKYSELPVKLDNKEKSRKINNYVLNYKDFASSKIKSSLSKEEVLSDILMLHYVAFIVMLEYRNKVWPYDYMTFSRRIGEIWEPFCKLPFNYASKELEIVQPCIFNDVKGKLVDNYDSYISTLKIGVSEKKRLSQYYKEIWKLVDSGNINLSLDLHFRQNGTFYNVDFKSGFGSNEKGNTNRLLQVGSIYSSLSTGKNLYKNLIFVRQSEEENNHYLQTLKNSPYWSVFCSENAYEQIERFTGFDIKSWMEDNMTWIEDISREFREYLEEKELLNYLVW